MGPAPRTIRRQPGWVPLSPSPCALTCALLSTAAPQTAGVLPSAPPARDSDSCCAPVLRTPSLVSHLRGVSGLRSGLLSAPRPTLLCGRTVGPRLSGTTVLARCPGSRAPCVSRFCGRFEREGNSVPATPSRPEMEAGQATAGVWPHSAPFPFRSESFPRLPCRVPFSRSRQHERLDGRPQCALSPSAHVTDVREVSRVWTSGTEPVPGQGRRWAPRGDVPLGGQAPEAQRVPWGPATLGSRSGRACVAWPRAPGAERSGGSRPCQGCAVNAPRARFPEPRPPVTVCFPLLPEARTAGCCPSLRASGTCSSRPIRRSASSEWTRAAERPPSRPHCE